MPATHLRHRPLGGQSTARVKWLMRRVAAMEARELVARGRQALRVQEDIARGALRLELTRRGSSSFDRAIRPSLLSRDRAADVQRITPNAEPSLLEEAKAFADGDFNFLGYPPVYLERPVAYVVDPFTSGIWPRKHGLLLDYRTAAVGDPKWIWELNRLQHIPLLLAASLLSNDHQHAAIALADAEAWLAQDAPGRGIAWSNGYEPALRAISLSLTLDALRGIEIGAMTLRDRILDSLTQHIRWIRRYPSLFSSANNHRVGELVGVIAASALAPELGQDAAAAEALTELHQRCDELIAPDGSHREQSFAYTIFTLELLLVAGGVLRSTAGGAPTWLDGVFERAAAALRLQLGSCDPDPRYGDRDDGGATLLGGRTARHGRAVLAALSYALGESDAGVVRHLDASAIWLFGDVAQRERDSTNGIARSGWLKDGGIVLLRAGASTVSFDVGSLGFGSLAAHGHADALHLTIAHGGSLLIGDPGTGSYFGDPQVRRAFRGTAGHATVFVDGVDQADQEGAFLWGRRQPAVRVAHVDLERRHAAAEHDGYTRLPDPVAHHREVKLIVDGLLLIRDVLTADGQHMYSQRWPFRPSTAIEQQADNSFRTSRDDKALLLQTISSSPCQTRHVSGSRDPFEGWWSDGLESVDPAPLISYDAVAYGGVQFVTLIVFGDRDHGLESIELEVDWCAQFCVVRNGRERVVAFGTPIASRASAEVVA